MVRQIAQQATADELAELELEQDPYERDDDGLDAIVQELLAVATQIGQWPVDFLPPR
jgi:hypothetical protein